MDKLSFPIIKVDDNIVRLHVNLAIYAKEAINAVCYKYTGLCYAHQDLSKEDKNILVVTLEGKEEMQDISLIGKQFCNDLIDQQVRFETESKYGYIRDLIVEQAFKPVNK